MLFISIAFTLLALIAGMMLLAKAKKEELGKLYSGMAYLVIVVSLLILVCEGTRGVMRMCCSDRGCPPAESGMCGSSMMYSGCDRGGCMMMRHGWMKRDGMSMEDMEHCKRKGGPDCCKGKMKQGCETEMEEEIEKDTLTK